MYANGSLTWRADTATYLRLYSYYTLLGENHLRFIIVSQAFLNRLK